MSKPSNNHPSHPRALQVTVFGANGDTGQEIVNTLRRRNHTVVAAVRRPDELRPVSGVTLKKIALHDHNSLVDAISGSDAVVSALGTGSLKTARKYTDLYLTATRAIRKAMRHVGVKRLVVLSSGGVEEEGDAPWFYNAIIRRYIMNTYLDMARMETVLEESDDLDWTSVRLTQLLKGDSKPYIVNDRTLDGKGNFKIHFVDVADFITKELEDGRWVKKMPVLSYP